MEKPQIEVTTNVKEAEDGMDRPTNNKGRKPKLDAAKVKAAVTATPKKGIRLVLLPPDPSQTNWTPEQGLRRNSSATPSTKPPPRAQE